MTAPPTGPPRSWSGHGNGNGNGTAGVFPPGGVGLNGQQLQQHGQKLSYGAPPSFAPPMGPPSSSSGNGVGPGPSVGQGGYGGSSMARVASMPAGVYGGGQGAAPPVSAPGQVRGVLQRPEGVCFGLFGVRSRVTGVGIIYAERSEEEHRDGKFCR